MFTPCIFCRSESAKRSEEHILPEGLVGDQDFTETNLLGSTRQLRFVLDNGEVCEPCNIRLGSTIDSMLQKQLGILKVMWNAKGTKRGKAASFEKPGLHVTRDEHGLDIALNAEKYDVWHGPQRKKIKPWPANTDIPFDPGRGETEIPISIKLSQKFIRALYKIAFETLCFSRGVEKVLDQRYDGLRSYILDGRGHRKIALLSSPGTHPKEALARPLVSLERIRYSLDYLATIQFAIVFGVDLSPDEEVIWPHGAKVISDRERRILDLTIRWHASVISVEPQPTPKPRKSGR